MVVIDRSKILFNNSLRYIQVCFTFISTTVDDINNNFSVFRESTDFHPAVSLIVNRVVRIIKQGDQDVGNLAYSTANKEFVLKIDIQLNSMNAKTFLTEVNYVIKNVRDRNIRNFFIFRRDKST